VRARLDLAGGEADAGLSSSLLTLVLPSDSLAEQRRRIVGADPQQSDQAEHGCGQDGRQPAAVAAQAALQLGPLGRSQMGPGELQQPLVAGSGVDDDQRVVLTASRIAADDHVG
jgi:hypothetical protein